MDIQIIRTKQIVESFVRYGNESIDNRLDDQVRAHILFEVFIYSILFVIGACSNLLVLYKLNLKSNRKSSLNILISQLNVADLIVIIVTIPIEIIFDIYNLYELNNNMQLFCQLLQTLRTLGFYLSSMILICISIDRYYAFCHPLEFYNTRERNKRMVIIAWIASILLSIPQSTIVHLKYYPKGRWVQCVTYGYLKNKYMAALINLKSILALYFLPLIVICYCYVRILLAIHNVPDFIKDVRKFSKKNKNLSYKPSLSKPISTSRSFPSYSCIALNDESFSINEEQKNQLDKIELNSINNEKATNSKDKLKENFKDNLRGSKKENQKEKQRENQKEIQKENQKENLIKPIDDLPYDLLIDSEISLASKGKISDEEIRRRRTSRQRIVLNKEIRSKRSESLSLTSEKAKNTIKKDLTTNRSLNLNRNHYHQKSLNPSSLNRLKQKPLIKDFRSIEKREFSDKNIKNLNKENDVRKLSIDIKNSNKSNDTILKNNLEKKIYRKLTKTSKICSLINKAKLNKNNNNLKDKESIKQPIKRSKSQEEFGSNFKLKKSSRLLYDEDLDQVSGNLVLNSREVLMSRAKRKTLKVTILIISAFICCWTPYVSMVIWHQLLEESARQVNEWIQELFFLMAVANSCINGLVVYTIHM